MTKRFGFHSNTRGADEIKELPISIDVHKKFFDKDMLA